MIISGISLYCLYLPTDVSPQKGVLICLDCCYLWHLEEHLVWKALKRKGDASTYPEVELE